VRAVRLWAPTAGSVTLEIAGDTIAMDRAGGGWWHAEANHGAGADYGFRMDADPRVLPDPRSAWQPQGVHGRSRIYDHGDFTWTDAGWRGVYLPGAVLYEMHVGTFTMEGTFDAARDRLHHLVDLGIDAVELLPCNAFPGTHGWGYDGVDLFAVHQPYGGPDGLKRFVDAAHTHGLGVVMDVVHNHLGAGGNYLNRFGPYFTDAHSTPWGPAVNLDGPGSDEVREFLIDNALMWLRDYHCDGLRLDAVHALADTRALHLLEELAVAVDGMAADVDRPLFAIAESDLNDPRLVRAREAGGFGLAATWTDDVHHALHATLTGERGGYYVDFGPLPVLAKALTSAYVHDGTFSTYRGRHHGRPVGELPGARFVTFLQDHDQVGNRALGERLAHLTSPGLARVGALLLLTAPYVPMLFMGEEWAAGTPWQFFTSHEDPELSVAVTDGRSREFPDHGWGASGTPDPQDPATRGRSILRWEELDGPDHAAMLDLYRRLIALRRASPDLRDCRRDRCTVQVDPTAGTLLMRRGMMAVAVNFSGHPAAVHLPGPAEVLLATGPGCTSTGSGLMLGPETGAVARLSPATAVSRS